MPIDRLPITAALQSDGIAGYEQQAAEWQPGHGCSARSTANQVGRLYSAGAASTRARWKSNHDPGESDDTDSLIERAWEMHDDLRPPMHVCLGLAADSSG